MNKVWILSKHCSLPTQSVGMWSIATKLFSYVEANCEKHN